MGQWVSGSVGQWVGGGEATTTNNDNEGPHLVEGRGVDVGPARSTPVWVGTVLQQHPHNVNPVSVRRMPERRPCTVLDHGGGY